MTEEAAPTPRGEYGPRPRGIVAPIPTPFDEDGEIDRSALAQLVDFYVRAKVHALFALGSVGQGPAMRADQRRTAAELIIDRVGGAVPVVLHVGTADLQTTLQIARHGAALRPAALAVSPPYYYGDHTPFEVSAHFAAVAEAVDMPIYVYDNPRYAGIAMSPAATFRLAKALPAISGIIAEHATLDTLLQHLRTLAPTFDVFAGSIECLLPTVPYGLAGVTSAACSAFPELSVALWESMSSHDYETAFPRQRQLNDLTAVLERHVLTSGRTVYRDTLRMRGLSIKRYPRWPSQDLEEEGRNRLYEELDALGAFAAPRAPEPVPSAAESATEGGTPEPAEPIEAEASAAPEETAGEPAMAAGSEGAEAPQRP